MECSERATDRASNGDHSSPVCTRTCRCCSSRELHSAGHTAVGRTSNLSNLSRTRTADVRTCRVRSLPCTVLYSTAQSVTVL